MALNLQGARTFLREVRDEFGKVSKPSLPELRNSTTVVMITVAMIGLLTGALDLVFNQVVQLFLR